MPGLLLKYAPQLLGALLVAAALWAAYDWAHDRGTASERARWEEATREAGERFSAALEAQQARLEELDGELGKARRSANKTREKLSDAIQTDPAARDWAADLVPDRVRDALRDPQLPADPAQLD